MNEAILIVEDDLIVANDIRRTLEKSEYIVSAIARSVDEALEAIAKKKPLLAILDIYLEGPLTGIDLSIHLTRLEIPFIYLSANSNQQILEKVKVTEPYGFIVKPFREKDLIVCLDIARYRLAQGKQIRDNSLINTEPTQFEVTEYVSNKISKKNAFPNFEGIIGSSLRMKNVFRLIGQVAPMNTSVLITGESGTGKEGVASAIHRLSGRKAGPFIKINCAALPMHLIESELFGHEKGSFTGAFERKIGKFEQAAGGTILLDEIGEMPPDMQVKLLRVLQEREMERIGGTRSIKVDVRIIAATNKNIEKEIAGGRFRLDLYYRLLVFPITMPALRDRAGDIELLIKYFVQIYALKSNKRIDGISDQALNILLNHNWPGNVRELEHLIERTVLLTETATIKEVVIMGNIGHTVPTNHSDNILKTMQEMENAHILDVLQKCNNKLAGPGGAAEVLGMPPSTLYSKMKKLGIVRKFGS